MHYISDKLVSDIMSNKYPNDFIRKISYKFSYQKKFEPTERITLIDTSRKIVQVAHATRFACEPMDTGIMFVLVEDIRKEKKIKSYKDIQEIHFGKNKVNGFMVESVASKADATYLGSKDNKIIIGPNPSQARLKEARKEFIGTHTFKTPVELEANFVDYGGKVKQFVYTNVIRIDWTMNDRHLYDAIITKSYSKNKSSEIYKVCHSLRSAKARHIPKGLIFTT